MPRPRSFAVAILSSMLVAATLSSSALAQATNATPPSQAANASVPPDWVNPFPPHRVMGNLYYVGSKGLASYLVTTQQGNILINSSLETSVPLIQASVEKLGFNFRDTEILLISHAHWDHDAGSAAIKKLTGAQYMVMDADVPVVESGGTTDFHYGKSPENL